MRAAIDVQDVTRDRRGLGQVQDGIRVNAVAPGAVYTPLHRNTPKDVMESLSPMGRPSTVKEIADAVMFLTDAATVTGDILYVDGGAHFGRW
jgi:NAD(P)-dependent dehydrogenase (short-subunit alcohol dehydrogenase family)